MQEQKPTHRRHNRWHNYYEKCIYHITLVVKDRKPLLGNLLEVKDGDPATICPWMYLTEKDVEYYGKAWMNLTPLGMDVARCIIMSHEAAVRDLCLKEGHYIIQIVDNGFLNYSTCPGGLFEYC